MTVTPLDQHNHHVFTPFLYQVATALLEPSEVAQPVRSLIRRSENVAFRLGRVTDVDLLANRVQSDHGPIAYDYLVLAAGSVSNYFHNTDIATRSLGLKDLAETLQLRNQILSCFEQASWTTDLVERAQLLSFAVVGGGPTGVEFAAALTVLVAGMVKRDFPALDRDDVRIMLVEGADAPLGTFAEPLRASATSALRAKGVEVRSGVTVSDIDESGLILNGGERIDAATVVWAAGVSAAPLAEAVGVTLASHGRVPVSPTLQLAGHPEGFVVGDLAEISAGGDPLPMLAQVAIQSGRHAAGAIATQISDRRDSGPFHYRDLGTMTSVGRKDAVAEIGPLRLSGFAGWLAWPLVHIVRTVGLTARASVLISWISDYVFTDRPVRLITGLAPTVRQTPSHLPSPSAPGRPPCSARHAIPTGVTHDTCAVR